MSDELPQTQYVKPSVLIVELKREDKGRYVTQARRSGMKVGVWVQMVLNAALDDDLRHPRVVDVSSDGTGYISKRV